MNKVLLKQINPEWTVNELIEQVKIEKILEPNCFIDGGKMEIVVLK